VHLSRLRRVEDLTVDELRRLLVEKRRQQRQQRLERWTAWCASR
jgi:hypothetical protein